MRPQRVWRTPRLCRLLEEAQHALQKAQRMRFALARSRRWRLTLLQHRIQRLQEALGQRKPPVRRKSAYRSGEAARLLAVSQRTIHRWVVRGRLQGWRTRGGHLRIPHSEVIRVKQRRRV